ncbi:MAG TPA: hypothetical protein VD996_15970 [Chitinophagaceae bacterium]|nr:hypothetical protein [Chitinophagaceae bacterium]
MNKASLLILFLLAFTALHAQNNALILQKKGRTQKTYFAGHFIALQTKQGNYADGIITRITNDSLYIRHFDIEKTFTEYGGIYFDTAFRYTTSINVKDIGAIMRQINSSNRNRNAKLLMIAGGGVLVLGAVNGIYRKDPPRDWYQPSSYISAGALLGGGLLLSRAAKRQMTLGKKYSIKILPLTIR